jgi:hypothetical protein
LLTAVVAVAAACAEPPAPAKEHTDDSRQAETTVITLAQEPEAVLRALVAVLVRRGEMEAGTGQRLMAQDASTRLEVAGQSVPLSRDELLAFVTTGSAEYVTGEGGRYVVAATVEPDPDGGTRLALRPVLIATGGGSPLGGRPLPSNGTLERQLLRELNVALARTP